MSWTLVSTGTTATVNGAGPLSVPAPASIARGNLLVLHYFGYEGNFGTQTITLPSGFTLVRNTADAASEGSRNILAYKIATASEPANYSVSWGGAGNAQANIFITQWSGNLSAPLDSSSFNAGISSPAASPLTISATSFTTGNANELLIWQGMGACDNTINPGSVALPSGYSSLGSGNDPSNFASYQASYATQAAVGPTGTPSSAYTFYAFATGGWSNILTAFVPFVASSPIVNSSGIQTFSNTAGPVTYTTSWSVGSGNTLLVLFSNTDNNNNGTGIQSIADGQGSYTRDASFSPSSSSFQIGTFSLGGSTSGTHVIVLTMNPSAAAYGSFVVVELMGTYSFDAILGSQLGSIATPTVTGGAPAHNDIQIALYCGTTANNEPPSIPSGWNGSYMGIPSSGWPSAAYVWKQSVAAAGTVSFGTLAVSDTWAAMIVGYSPQPTGATTLVAAGTSYALTGSAATLLQTQQVSASTLLANPGVFDFIGAQSQSNLQIYANNSVFALTGENVLLSIGLGAFSISAATGIYVFTGEAAVLQRGTYIFPVNTGFFAETGGNATFAITTPTSGSVFVPNLVGLDWLYASQILYFGGFAEIDPLIVKISGMNKLQQQGVVVGQNPSPHVPVQPGTAVQLSVGSDHMLSVAFEKRL